MGEYVDCLIGSQTVCTHYVCRQRTPLCCAHNPNTPWRKCTKFRDHKGPHYVPPESFNYEYWND